MALKVSDVVKRSNGTYTVTIVDDSDIIGVDDTGKSIYRKHVVVVSPKWTEAQLKKRLLDVIRAGKQDATDAQVVKTTVQAVLSTAVL